ncbi:MAG: polyribonucleotide nucleotidyltransferase, partial [Candidatus Aminicenantes bacterium]|nr:polyribonucleotide nucleotidyltransferase [Candidatus Aminicenantes bacterium]
EIEKQTTPKILEALKIKEKKRRGSAFDELLDSLLEPIPEEEEEKIANTKYIFQEIKKKLVRKKILEEGVRIDGRQFKEIRPIECSVGLLPRTHGSAMFTRGETQALATVTLGTESDAQTINGLEEEFSKKFILHYNFPPFSVGEVKFLRGPGRREIGHGALAERSLLPVMPAEEKFPYTVRLVSDILESHGSSSMATVCAGALALMDAGVPIRAAVAGLALGLIQEGEKNIFLSDIAGEEDHYGDMDFKAAGTSQGITAIQLDIKIKGLSYQLISDALQLAREGRLEILDKMKEAIQAPRPTISPYAPRLLQLTIPLDKIGVVIGPGGKMIRGIIEKTGAKIDINDDGKVTIASTDEQAALKALDIIKELTAEAEIGRTYTGTIRKVVDFGAFVEILPGIEGLLHISEVADHRIENIHRELKEGDKIVVKVINIDSQHRIQLSRKALLKNRDDERRPPYRNRRYE